MSFSFSFSGDDIEEDSSMPDAQSSNDTFQTDSTSNQSIPNTSAIRPKAHTFSDLLQSLPSQISYNYLDIPLSSIYANQSRKHQDRNHEDTIRIPRRSLFDIRQQLMHEADPIASDSTKAANNTANLLTGLETGDLSTGIYEGGFKTWECAVDLASYVFDNDLILAQGDDSDSEDEVCVVELGAGSAVPSLGLLAKVLRERMTKGVHGNLRERRVRFVLCDYNEDVLRLCTAVNVILTIVLGMAKTGNSQIETLIGEDDDGGEGDIEVDEGLVARCLQLLKDTKIEIDFISGAWGEEFSGVLGDIMTKVEMGRSSTTEELQGGTSSQTLVLGSETIYSPATLGVFSKTVLDILARSNGVAFVAAKKMYFGVGGGVAEFEQEVRKLGASTSVALDVQDAGVGRVVLEVKGSN